MEGAIGAQTLNHNFLETGFICQLGFIAVRCSATYNGQQFNVFDETA
jgi:hypothetical protein